MSDFIDITKADRELAAHFKENGFGGIGDVLKQKVNEWRVVPVNVAIIGCSGSGKSSFINAIRNLMDDDEGAATVGFTEETTTPTPFKFPGNEKLMLWDLPGVGTKHFPKYKYLETIKVDRYDFFIIMTAERFQETDTWFGREIKKRKKTFYYVRTKVDQNVTNANKNKKTWTPKEEILSVIRKDCRENLKSDFPEVPVFLISNHDRTAYDFPEMFTRIVMDVPEWKRESLVLSLQARTENLIEEKKKYLKSRIWKIAGLSALAALVPIPGVSVCADILLLVEEVDFYKKQFAFDSETLSRFERDHGGVGIEKALVLNVVSTTRETIKVILDLLKRHCVSQVSEEVARYIPFVGSAIGSGISFATTHLMLSQCLNDLVEDAKKVMAFLKQEATDTAASVELNE